MAQVTKAEVRQRRKKGLRKKVRGQPGRPRLTVFRSVKHLYVQLIDDKEGKVLAVASTVDKEVREALVLKRAEAEKLAAEAALKNDGDAADTEVEAEVADAAPEKKKGKKKDKKGGKAKKEAKEKAPRRKTLRYRPGTSTGKLLDAAVVGEVVARRCKDAGFETVVFDRNGFRYHGRVAALADAARSAGLKF